jgi:hypothetical protein
MRPNCETPTGAERVRLGLIKISAGIAAAVVLAAGCSDKQSGTALPATTTGGDGTGTSTRTAPPTSTGGAPAVKDPLDASRYLSQPCAILSATTLTGLKVSRPGIPDTDSPVAKTSGPQCVWHTDDQPVGQTYGVGFLTGNKNGLSDTYRGGKKAFPGYFEPTEVNGYPAVFNDLTDDRANGSCNITVGISSSLAFRAGIEGSKDTGTRSCDLVKQLAVTVIQTLKGA